MVVYCNLYWKKTRITALCLKAFTNQWRYSWAYLCEPSAVCEEIFKGQALCITHFLLLHLVAVFSAAESHAYFSFCSCYIWCVKQWVTPCHITPCVFCIFGFSPSAYTEYVATLNQSLMFHISVKNQSIFFFFFYTWSEFYVTASEISSPLRMNVNKNGNVTVSGNGNDSSCCRVFPRLLLIY